MSKSLRDQVVESFNGSSGVNIRVRIKVVPETPERVAAWESWHDRVVAKLLAQKCVDGCCSGRAWEVN